MSNKPTNAELTARVAELEAEGSNLRAENAALKAQTAPTGSSEAPSFDPLELLTPEAVAGIKPMLRLVRDGLKQFPFLSKADSLKVRHLADWLKQLLTHLEGAAVEPSEPTDSSEPTEAGAE